MPMHKDMIWATNSQATICSTYLPLIAFHLGTLHLHHKIHLRLLRPHKITLQLCLQLLAADLELVQLRLRLADHVSLLQVLFLPVHEVGRGVAAARVRRMVSMTLSAAVRSCERANVLYLVAVIRRHGSTSSEGICCGQHCCHACSSASPTQGSVRDRERKKRK